MGATTGIEWTDSTWNPLRGCSKVSAGCDHCYAETMAARFSGKGLPFEKVTRIGMLGTHWNGNVELVEKHLLDPMKWRSIITSGPVAGMGSSRPRRVFVNSMSDLFHPNVPDEWIDQIFAVMALCPQHTFQVLTKRPERMREYLCAYGRTSAIYNVATVIIGGDFSKMPVRMAHHRSSGDGWWPLPNVWLGVSIENQDAADERIPLLLQTPSAVRIVSCEPQLGAISLHQCGAIVYESFPEASSCDGSDGWYEISKIDWVICGGESGPGARPMHPDWARGLRDQCAAAGVPFFFKQWGEWLPAMCDGAKTKNGITLNCPDRPVRVGKKSAGSLLDGREYKAFPVVGV